MQLVLVSFVLAVPMTIVMLFLTRYRKTHERMAVAMVRMIREPGPEESRSMAVNVFVLMFLVAWGLMTVAVVLGSRT